MVNLKEPIAVTHSLRRILKVLRLERREISAIYFYAILGGLIQLSLPLGIQSIISFVLGGSISTSLVVLIILVVLGVFFNGLVSVNQLRIIEKVEQKLFVRYSFEYTHRIPHLDLRSVDGYYLPEMVNRFFDTVSLQKGIAKLLLDIPTATLQILFGLILLSFYHPIFIAFGVVLVLLVWGILYYSGPRGLATSIQESDYKYSVAGWIEELARSVWSFKFSRGSKLNLRHTDELVSGYLASRTSHFRILQLQYWTLIAFKVLITAAMLIVGSLLLIDQELNLGQFIAAEIVILLVIGSVEKLITNLDTIYDVLTSVEKLEKISDKPLEADGHVPLERSPRGMKVQLDKVRFGYRSDPVLNDIGFNIPPGATVAVMGPDGSGKSTLMRILSGVYRDHEGSVRIDDLDLREYKVDDFREQTGILFNSFEIFRGTLWENITMGHQRMGPREVSAFAERLGLADWATGKGPSLSDTIDPLGTRLPSSTVRKILLLRALVNEPRLLLLEEPFAGLDDPSWDRVRDHLFSLGGMTTVFVETNDEAFARRCDVVLRFSKDGLDMKLKNVN